MFVSGKAEFSSSLSVRSFVRLGSSLSSNSVVVGLCLSVSEQSVVSNLSVTGALAVTDVVSAEGPVCIMAIVSCNDRLILANSAEINGLLTGRNGMEIDGPITMHALSKLSASDSVELGSSLSVRAFVRLGNSLSVHTTCACNDISVRQAVTMGTVLSVSGEKPLLILSDTPIDVRTDMNVMSNLSVGESSVFGAHVSVGGSVGVGAGLTVMGYSRINDSLSVLSSVFAGSSLSVTTGGLIGGILSVHGPTILSEDVDVLSGGISIRGYSVVTGRASFGASVCIGSAGMFSVASHDTIFGGQLSTTQSTRFGSSIRVISDTNVDGHCCCGSLTSDSLTVTGPVSIQGNEVVSGSVMIASSLSVAGDIGGVAAILESLILTSTLSVQGNTNLNGPVSVNSGSTLLPSLSVSEKLRCSGLLSVHRETVSRRLSVDEAVIFMESMSVGGPLVLRSSLSVGESAQFESLGIKNDCDIYGGVSVAERVVCGTVSVRFDSKLSGEVRVGDAMHVDATVTVSAGLSVAGLTRAADADIAGSASVSGELIVFQATRLNGFVSVSGPMMCGSSQTVNGVSIMSSMSVQDHLQVGKSVSVVDIAVFKHGLSALQAIVAGSGFSSVGSTVITNDLSVGGALRLGDFSLYANETQMISATSNGMGCFYGTWSFETPVATSDRRLKSDITPLAKSLQLRKEDDSEPVSAWLLRELRPVSFVLNEGDGIRRFGFIAQELERVMPELVRKIVDSDGHSTEQTLSVIYQDLVAVLTMIVQDQDVQIAEMKKASINQEERIRVLEETVIRQAGHVDALVIEIQEILTLLGRQRTNDKEMVIT